MSDSVEVWPLVLVVCILVQKTELVCRLALPHMYNNILCVAHIGVCCDHDLCH